MDFKLCADVTHTNAEYTNQHKQQLRSFLSEYRFVELLSKQLIKLGNEFVTVLQLNVKICISKRVLLCLRDSLNNKLSIYVKTISNKYSTYREIINHCVTILPHFCVDIGPCKVVIIEVMHMRNRSALENACNPSHDEDTYYHSFYSWSTFLEYFIAQELRVTLQKTNV